MTLNISRRRLLQAGALTGAALALGFRLPVASARSVNFQDEDDVNAWLVIAPDGLVTIMVPTAELGQGVYTTAPMLVAEELECDWRQVRAQIALTNPVYNNRMFKVQAVASSTSARWSFEPLRRIGAYAREMLKLAAAQRWEVELAEVSVFQGQVRHEPSGRHLAYGELAAQAFVLPRPEQVQLKPASQWRLLGKSVQRLDIPLKTSGLAQFGMDVQVPDMLVGAIAACPYRGGRLVSVEDGPALARKGVRQVVKLDQAVIVLADHYWAASMGLFSLKPQWAAPQGALLQSDALMEQLRDAAASDGVVALQRGDSAAMVAQQEQWIEVEYEVPYLAHATMEPMNATVHVQADSVQVWGSTQVAGELAGQLAPVLGMKEEQVTVHSTFVGGGFGRREEFDVFIQAALASKASGRPVKLVWSREEDIQQDFYRPAATALFRAVLDKKGMPWAMEVKLACSSIYIRNFPDRVKAGVDPKSVEGVVDHLYSLPNMTVRYAMVNTVVPAGFWRGVGYTQNCFFLESFVDDLARAAGKDPLGYRLALLEGQDRAQTLLRRLSDELRWGHAAEGCFHGIAFSSAWGSLCGVGVELSLEGKDVVIHRVVCAIDCGPVLNPATVRRQLEGGIVWALASVFDGEITVKDGQVQQSNFHNYHLPGLKHMFPIECLLLTSDGPIGGVGESAVPPFAPALCNALLAATGERAHSLPLRRHGYRQAV